jgi:hypothetical protein
MSFGNATVAIPGLNEDFVATASKFAFMAHGFVLAVGGPKKEIPRIFTPLPLVAELPGK